MSLFEKIAAAATKLGVEVHELEAHVHRELDHLLGLADDNLDAAKAVVKQDAKKLAQGVSDVAEKAAGDVSDAAHNVGDVAKDVPVKVNEDLK